LVEGACLLGTQLHSVAFIIVHFVRVGRSKWKFFFAIEKVFNYVYR